MEYFKIYKTSPSTISSIADVRNILKYRPLKDIEKTEFQNSRKHVKYIWVRMWNDENLGWYAIDETILNDVYIPITDRIITTATLAIYGVGEFSYIIETEYLIKLRKEKLNRLKLINNSKHTNL